MYHAKLHPEQYSDTFSPAQLKQLHSSILYVCQTAVETLADSEKFPNDWLFKHRWGKGKKDSKMELPNGAKITFLTVGGRTSCVVPSVQKKTGATAGEIEEDNAKATAKGSNKKSDVVVGKADGEDNKGNAVKEDAKPKLQKRKADAPSKDVKKVKTHGGPVKPGAKSTVKEEVNGYEPSRRRSGRLSKN